MSGPSLVNKLDGLCKAHLPTCCEAAERIRELKAALERAAQFLKDWDGGDPNTADGWAFDEFLAEWTAIRSLLSEGGGE